MLALVLTHGVKTARTGTNASTHSPPNQLGDEANKKKKGGGGGGVQSPANPIWIDLRFLDKHFVHRVAGFFIAGCFISFTFSTSTIN